MPAIVDIRSSQSEDPRGRVEITRQGFGLFRDKSGEWLASPGKSGQLKSNQTFRLIQVHRWLGSIIALSTLQPPRHCVKGEDARIPGSSRPFPSLPAKNQKMTVNRR